MFVDDAIQHFCNKMEEGCEHVDFGQLFALDKFVISITHKMTHTACQTLSVRSPSREGSD